MTRTRGTRPHIVLDERAFGSLVKGEPIELVAHDGTQVAVLLADIGFTRMTNLLLDALETAFDADLAARAPRRRGT
ncbi:MAG TPA: hypothetical protein VGF07_13190 [Stellaceae bacterium]|jgi:hypothetical protein